MQIWCEEEILSHIAQGDTFVAGLNDGSLRISLQDYVPYLCTAIHAGHRLSTDLAANCSLTSRERLQEEDPYTNLFIESFPISFIVEDSRYEYDLNRDLDECLYEEAWGRKVWHHPLNPEQRQRSLAKHQRYYNLLEAVIKALHERFGGCLLFDIHSYNWQVRKYNNPPIFNLGTKYLNTRRWRIVLNIFEKNLAAIELPNLETTVARDIVFQGSGYQPRYAYESLPNTVVFPLEIKKIFMDEENGELFPLVLESLQEGIHLAVFAAAAAFNKRLARSNLKRANLLPSNIDPHVLMVDRSLFRLTKNINTLQYVNPINIQKEKRRFLAQAKYNPEFRYRQLRIDPYDFREKLYNLPVSRIQDPLIRSLYRAVVDSYAAKIELLTNVGTSQFIYNSLQYYGEPSPKDIANAKFLLHAAELPDYEPLPNNIDASEAKILFENAVQEMNLDCKVILSTRLVAKATYDKTRNSLLVNRNTCFTSQEVNALIHHELGIHMTTTLNADQQPLNILKIGLPGNTFTQEGLAVLSEYLSGNITIYRLRQLSLRVLAVEMMIKGMSFYKIYNRIREEYNISTEDAFILTTRVFRGGGFTKDYLYLKGFKSMVELCNTKNSLITLLMGKTSVQFLDTLHSLLYEREILRPPKYIPPALGTVQMEKNNILAYLIRSIN